MAIFVVCPVLECSFQVILQIFIKGTQLDSRVLSHRYKSGLHHVFVVNFIIILSNITFEELFIDLQFLTYPL